jgi:alginate O-acetyltransferase complex protein AlgI
MFLIVSLSWIPFRAPDPATLFGLLGALTRPATGALLPPIVSGVCLTATAMTLVWQFYMRDQSLAVKFARLSALARGGVLGICLIGIFLCSGGDQRAFIYFQF